MATTHRYVRVIVPVLGQVDVKRKCLEPPFSPPDGNNFFSFFLFILFFFYRVLICRKHRFKVRRSPSHIRHLLPSATAAVLPMKELHYQQHQHYHLHAHDRPSLQHGGRICTAASGVDGGMDSKTQTTLLQHNLGPPDLPPLYQPQHRASV